MSLEYNEIWLNGPIKKKIGIVTAMVDPEGGEEGKIFSFSVEKF